MLVVIVTRALSTSYLKEGDYSIAKEAESLKVCYIWEIHDKVARASA